MKRILAESIFTGDSFLTNQVLVIDDQKIIGLDSDTTRVDEALPGLVAPGYIDLQVNGGGGILFNSTPTIAGIKKIMLAHARYGTTAMLPTIITDDITVMEQAADAISQAIAEKIPGIIGIHFEGPHLSVAKKGAHSEQYIRPISDAEWQIFERTDLGQMIVTLAPENVLLSDVKRMVALGIKVCLGHTNADFDTCQQAIAAGADGFTHLFNAMSPLQGRAPGAVGSALLNDKASCGIIVDGHHVDFSTCQLALKNKAAEQLFLVTDAMPPVGTDDQVFDFFDRQVFLNEGKLTSTTGELAGSVLDMATAVRNCHQHLNVGLAQALRLASYNPAKYIQQHYCRGKLAVGYQADFIVLNQELKVEETWVSGHKVS